MPARPPIDSVQRRRTGDRLARRAVQIGFLLLFLYPLLLVIYQRVTFRATPNFASWLLPWDPLLLAGHLARREWTGLVIGAPLLLIALTLILGRFFCGWVCPIGTVLDLVRPLAFWQKRRKSSRATRLFPANANSHLRYYLLIAVALAGLFSLQALGLLDPLVIFQRAMTALASNFFALQQPPQRIFLSVISLLFVAILLLELWQPRFWCRNLCPLGALLSLFSRFSLLNRQVSSACSFCGDCRRACVMNAIPRKEPHDTDYSDCTFCLECESACPNTGISFAFGTLAGKRWQRNPQVSKLANQQSDNPRSPVLPLSQSPDALASKPRFQGSYQPKSGKFGGPLTRRELFGGLAAGAAGLALVPVVERDRRGGVLRPPGALHEEAFVRTCILCQECVRVCPTGGLKPTTFEAGLAAVGTPQLVPLTGACTRNPSCPGLCAQVCPVGAIQPIAPEQVKIGRAVVDHPLCLAWDQQVKCLVCVEACLVEAAQVYNGRIIVDPQRCTGCGRCENACPVASSAIRVKPFSAFG
ncbi:MAG: 4Fe-4S binding protein [Anaerolineae bacterium]|nr:4Fe-4S binding protein [Anaerolineae bacterium]